MRRRGILGTLAGAFAAGPSVTKAALTEMAPALSVARPMNTITQAAVAAVPDVAVSAWRIPEGPFRDLLRAAYARAQQEDEIQSVLRDYCRRGFDVDIAVNKSWSQSFKAHVQEQRVRERCEARFALHERVWGD